MTRRWPAAPPPITKWASNGGAAYPQGPCGPSNRPRPAAGRRPSRPFQNSPKLANALLDKYVKLHAWRPLEAEPTESSAGVLKANPRPLVAGNPHRLSCEGVSRQRRAAPRARWILRGLLVGTLLCLGVSFGAADAPAPTPQAPIPDWETPPKYGPAAWEWVGSQAAREGDLELARLAWGTAYDMDPTLWSPALHIAASYGFKSPQQASHWVLRALIAGWSSFRNQYFVFVNVLLLIVGASLMTTLLMAFIWSVREIPLVYHGFLEMLKKTLPLSVSAVGAAVIFGLPLFANLGFLATLAMPVAFGTLMFKHLPRKGVALLGLSTILSPLGLLLLGILALPVNPLHPVALLERAQRGAGDHHLRLVIDKEIQERPGDPYLRFARSWMACETGEHQLADEDLAFLEATGGITRSTILVNRAALDLTRGDSEGALVKLLEARRLTTTSAPICYDLALAYGDLMDLERAQEELRRAQEADPNKITEADRLHARLGSLQPMRERLNNAELWTAALGSHRSIKGFPIPRPMALLFPAGNPWLLWPTAGALGLVLIIFLPGIRSLRLRGCSRCGRPICRRCVVRIGFRSLCRACAATVRSKGRGWDEPKVSWKGFPWRMISSHRLGALVPWTLGLLLPGLPQVLQDRNLKGSLYIFVASAAWLVLFHAGPPVHGLGGGEVGVYWGTPWVIVPAVALLLLGLLSGREAKTTHVRREKLSMWIGTEVRKAA